MATFSVFCGSTLVGTSELEGGDPPMGVAFGQFCPNANYGQIQSECIRNHADQSRLGLWVQTPAGDIIKCAGVGILDLSPELGRDGIEVNVLGISYPPYGKLFPHHVAAYEQRLGEAPRDDR